MLDFVLIGAAIIGTVVTFGFIAGRWPSPSPLDDLGQWNHADEQRRDNAVLKRLRDRSAL